MGAILLRMPGQSRLYAAVFLLLWAGKLYSQAANINSQLENIYSELANINSKPANTVFRWIKTVSPPHPHPFPIAFTAVSCCIRVGFSLRRADKCRRLCRWPGHGGVQASADGFVDQVNNRFVRLPDVVLHRDFAGARQRVTAVELPGSDFAPLVARARFR